MSAPIEDYALIGDTQTAALVGRDGSIDWLCLPEFDSGACFAALLGDENNGRWKIAPRGSIRGVGRRYASDSLVLETEFDAAGGRVRVTDLMLIRKDVPDVVRIVEGIEGRVDMEMELVVRFDYGSIVPWVRNLDGRLSMVAGPDALVLDTPVEMRGEDLSTRAGFSVGEGDRVPFVLTWYSSRVAPPKPVDPFASVVRSISWWKEWASKCRYDGAARDEVMRSLITLKALTYAPSGGIVAAPTTSLPERLGGVRNWDYRYCWLRDATFTLYALLGAGYTEEAVAWRDWLLRAVAGEPSKIQIMYGSDGERRLPELELEWLSGYESSRPVRVGNAAVKQFQLDVYGELMDSLHQSRKAEIAPQDEVWSLQLAIMDFLEGNWREPDEGIWEVQGPRRQFTHSKVMAWVAIDRAVKAVEWFGREGPVDRWRAKRTEIFEDVCANGFETERNTFTQFYGSREVDASLLMIPLVGFLDARDPRVRGTIEAIREDLCVDGFVLRYRTEDGASVDGIPGDEGAFLACSFWFADNLALMGDTAGAGDMFERLLSVSSDLGLLAEEYDMERERLVGNFPQAFSHVALINTAWNLSRTRGAAFGRGADEAAFGRGADEVAS